MFILKLEHVGEQLIAQMLVHSATARDLVSGDSDFHYAVDPEAPLWQWCGRRFDGAHRLDIGLFDLSARRCIAVEAKLGLTRMSAREFTRRFLNGCGTSHEGRRIKGSVISILERKLPGAEYEPIEVVRDGKTYVLDSPWTLIVRDEILEAWSRSERPPLSEKCRILSLQRIVESFGDKESFNNLVTDLVKGDYYEQWFSVA
jgi:hypothetical protein